MTFSDNDRFGFRSEICFPYHPISDLINRHLSIIEMPTSLMDWTILNKKMKPKEATKLLTDLINNVERFNGLLATSFHNTYLNKETFPEIYGLYSLLLEDATKSNYWITTAKECCKWWLRRENTHIGLTLKDKCLEGRTTIHPVPLVIDDSKSEKKYANVQEEKFRISIN